MPQWGTQDYKDAVFQQLSQGSSGGGGDEHDHYEHYDNFANHAPPEDVQAGVGEAFHPDRLPADQADSAFRSAAEKMQPNERSEIVSSLMGELQKHGLAPSWLQKTLGLGSHDPSQASADDVAKITEYSRQNHPEVFQKVVAEKPWFVRMLNKPLVAGLVGIIAGKLLNRGYDNSGPR
jgi:hypothetical protein